MFACMHWNSADVPVLFFLDGHLCFFRIFFVILLAGGVSECAFTHVHICLPLILA